jgi:hypothetical protein
MNSDDPELDELLRDPWEDLPELERLGIFTGSAVDYGPPFAEVARRVRELRAAEEPYADEHGYLWQVTAAAVDEEAGRTAWVEWRERDAGRVVDAHYYLKARDGEGLVVRWEIETYNPYFGCRVGYLGWHGGDVVLVYADKHDSYVASAGRGRDVRRVLITLDWTLEGDVLSFRDADGAPAGRLSLPALEPLPVVPPAEAE